MYGKLAVPKKLKTRKKKKKSCFESKSESHQEAKNRQTLSRRFAFGPMKS